MSDLLRELASGWAGWIWPRALQFGVAALLLLAAERWLLRRTWPRLRLALHSILLLGLVLPGSIAAPWSARALMGPASTDVASDVGASGAAANRIAGALVVAGFLVWAAIAAVLWIGATRRHQFVRARLRALDVGAPRQLREQVAALSRRLGLRRVPELVVAPASAGAALVGPAVIGCRRPILLVPESLAAQADRAGGARPAELVHALDHALVHELLHLRRGDLWSAAASRLVASLWWFHPLAWAIARRAATLRELCCDEDAIRCLDGRAHEYRATLLDHAQRLLGDRTPAGSLGFFAGPSAIVARLEWLSRPRVRRPRLERGAAWAAAVALAIAAWPTAAPALERPRAGRATGTSADRVQAAALEVVRAALGPQRPPGCLTLHHAVKYLASRTPSPD